MTHLPTSALRDNLGSTLDLVTRKGKRVVLQRRGRDVVAIVSLDDLELLHDIENVIDVEGARRALKEPGTIPWRKVKRQLGL